MAPTSYYLVLAAMLFTIGVVGVVVRRNAIVVFMCIELMLNAVNLTFVAFARMRENLVGHLAVFFVMVVAAVEAAIGLAIIISIFRAAQTVETDHVAE